MGVRTPATDSAAEVFNGCHSSLCKPVHEETCKGHNSNNLEKTPRAIILEDIDTLSSGGNVSMTVEELEISLGGTLHIKDSCEPFCSSVDSNHSDVCKDKDMRSLFVNTNTSKSMTVEELEISRIVHIEDSCETFGDSVDSNHSDVCKDNDTQSPFVDINTSKSMTVEELEISFCGILHIEDSCETLGNSLNSNRFDVYKDKDMLSPFVDSNSSKGFSMCESIACSEVVQSGSLNIDVNEGSSSTVIYIENSLMANDPRDACLMNPPIAPKIVSALKGNRRSQKAINNTEKLSVTWAPDVYDPPVTSESRTVRVYSQPSKVKKELYKHRHKGKSSRGSGSDKKHAHRRSTSSLIDPRILRLRALDIGSSLSKGYAGRSRSSCYTEPVPCLHLSVTEAS